MLFELIYRLFTLDVSWFADLVMNNLFFLFSFCALATFFFGKNKMLKGMMLVTLVTWCSLEMTNTLGLVWAVGGFLMLNYFTRIALVLFAENTAQLKSRLVVILFIQFYVLVVIYNVFLK